MSSSELLTYAAVSEDTKTAYSIYPVVRIKDSLTPVPFHPAAFVDFIQHLPDILTASVIPKNRSNPAHVNIIFQTNIVMVIKSNDDLTQWKITIPSDRYMGRGWYPIPLTSSTVPKDLIPNSRPQRRSCSPFLHTHLTAGISPRILLP